ncbi:hypothetical protein HWV62_28160 [Athelia sp. TMB]|nr:hypothetical protein HWV62_28160 [Athelia sp. TMB]
MLTAAKGNPISKASTMDLRPDATDLITTCLSLFPIPSLHTAFSALRIIWSYVQEAKGCERQLGLLARYVAELLYTLDGEYRARRLLNDVSSSAKEQASYSFLKTVYFKDKTTSQIDNFNRRIASCVTTYQISSLIEISAWQAWNDQARKADQEALDRRLTDLQANKQHLAANIYVQHANMMAMMVSLQRRISERTSLPLEHWFFMQSLQYLSTLSGSRVNVEDWMITSYEVEFGQQIGAGGISQVFKGSWNKTEVVLKVLKNQAGASPSSAVIRNEIKFLGANVLDDKPFIVVPYLANGNARDYLIIHPECNRLQLVHGISLGLVHLHSQQIVHGDLKAVNVLVDHGEMAVLCDFGLSRIFTGKVPLAHIDYGHFQSLIVDGNVRPQRPDNKDNQGRGFSDATWALAESCWHGSANERPTANTVYDTLSHLIEVTPPANMPASLPEPIHETASGGAAGNSDRTITRSMTFNTTGIIGGSSVTNVAGDYIMYGAEPTQLAVKMNLDKLPYVEGASWNPKLTCLPGTRSTILSLSQVWSCSRDSQNVFWLEGVTGSGKTSISNTVAQMLYQDGILVSSFFFNRDVGPRNSPQMLITTIVRDIANRHHDFAADISKYLEGEPALASAPLIRQYDALLWGPLQRHPIDKPIVVVIDALDESSSDGADDDLLCILNDEAHRLPPQFRIFITSRPTGSIHRCLSRKSYVKRCSIDINSPESLRDIAAYVDAQLQDDQLLFQIGSSAQDQLLINELKIKAEGLFIWIATVFSYLRTVYNPKAKLLALLSKFTENISGADKRMDTLYAAVLDSCADWEDTHFIINYQLIMGAIMAVERPLSLVVLQALCKDMQGLSPAILLRRFGSVIVGFEDEHEPIRLLHLSFREFVTDRADKAVETQKFFISKQSHIQRLASFCFETIARELEGAPKTGAGYLEIESEYPPGIPKLHGISKQLLYACEALPHHILAVETPGSIAPLFRSFLSHHRTRWFEIVASHGVFRGSLAVRRWLEVSIP